MTSAPAEPDPPRAVTLAPALLLLALAVALGMRAIVAQGAEAPTALRTLRLDMNSATDAQLRLLPGIGPSLAGRIAADRARLGPFTSINELERVRGIGPRTLRRLAPYATVGDADARLIH